MIKAVTEKPWLSVILLSGLILIIYSQTFSFDLLYNFDDDAYFFDPRISQLSFLHIKEYFSSYFLGMYQPLPVLSFSMILHFFPESVVAQRVVNIILHILNTLLVLIFINRLTGNKPVAFFTALLFAVHPMHVESVSWISTRSNLLYSSFFLLSLISYLKWQANQKTINWILMFVFFLLSLFSKVTATTLPFLLPLLDWYKGKKILSFRSLLCFPLLCISFVFILIGVQASGSFGHIADLGTRYSVFDRIIVFFHALGLYLFKAIAPFQLSAIYLYPLKQENLLPMFSFTAAILAIVTCSFLLMAGWKKRNTPGGKAILFGFLFFLITIMIVMPLKWSRTILIAERYTYLPYLGLTAGLLLYLWNFTLKKGRKIKTGFFILLLLITGIFAVQSFQRNKVWKSPLTLFTDVINQNHSPAEVSMGYYNRGNENYRLQKMDQALSDYNAALTFFPVYADAYYNRGLIYYNMGNVDSAILDFSHAIKLKPDYSNAYLNRGTAYRSKGDYHAALSDFSFVIYLKPDGAAYFSRAALYFFNLQNPDQACRDWNMALQLGFRPAKKAIDELCERRF